MRTGKMVCPFCLSRRESSRFYDTCGNISARAGQVNLTDRFSNIRSQIFPIRSTAFGRSQMEERLLFFGFRFFRSSSLFERTRHHHHRSRSCNHIAHVHFYASDTMGLHNDRNALSEKPRSRTKHHISFNIFFSVANLGVHPQ